VEHFLNFVWMLVSVLLFVHATSAGKTNVSARQTAKMLIALALLIVILMPIISATDDLTAMSSLMDPEHPEHIVRRGEMPLLELAQGAVSALDLACFLLLFIDLSFLRRRLAIVFLRRRTVSTLSGFARALFVRPPPATALLTA
jgi:hypothetical protein